MSFQKDTTRLLMENHHPFGMVMANRLYDVNDYRYGFQSQEKIDELKGEFNSLDFGERIFDPRLNRFLSLDPLTKSYPWYSPYQYAGNNPIANIDLDGREPLWFMEWQIKNLAKAKQDNPTAGSLELATKAAGNMLKDVLGYTDLNDATVLATAINRGPNKAINFDQSQASKSDLAFAAIGAVIPFVSGSMVKKLGEGLFETLSSSSRMTKLRKIGGEIDDILKNNERLRNSFRDGNYAITEASEDITVYRVSGGSSPAEGGSFFTTVKPTSSEEAESLLNINMHGNLGTEVTPVTIKKGTQMAIGDVAGGKGNQIFIPESLQKRGGNLVERHLDKTEKLK